MGTVLASLSASIPRSASSSNSFFEWLAGQPGYKSKLNYSDADYFSISEKDLRISRAEREKPVPSMEQMHHIIDKMPAVTEIEKRNRAIVALILLTGVRDGALVSLKLKHINIADKRLDQDAREVKTKFAKTFQTWFFPVGGDALSIIAEWVHYLRQDLLFGDDDPLFPKTLVGIGDNGFEVKGLDRLGWKKAGPVRKIFKEAFEGANLNYHSPHSVRFTLARYGQGLGLQIRSYKAWSKNLGHSNMMTTFSIYGDVPADEQAELIKSIKPGGASNDDPLIIAIAETVRKHNFGQ